MMEKRPNGKSAALWIKGDENTRNLLERLMVKLWKERGRMPKKSDVLKEALIEKARRHGVR